MMPNNVPVNNIIYNSTVYDKYELISIIGKGGMGIVYLVRDLKNKQYYALKYRNNDLNNTNLSRFIAERKLLGRLNCKNIPKLFDYYEDEKEQYYVMEYIDGTTLHKKISDNGYLSTRQAVYYAKQIAEALGELHANGIIHRDIKSQNILVNVAHEVKVVDLGISLSKESQRLTKTNAVVCSPYYAAPELSIKSTKITKAVDIYALGIVLFEMIIGKYPFEGEVEAQTILMHRKNTFPDPRSFRDIQQALANVIIKATAKNPNDRYQDVWEFIDDLSTCLDKERFLEKPLSPKTLQTKKSIPDVINSNWFLVGAILFILAIIITVILLVVFL
ncbi:serine/threonine-protein kinase [Mycoplasma hafezii]|uniref:serine/threonine-protein kinase n=1 Tax=Mycoplasma hafezii TaxID=525886 RepID=UPI003CE8E4F5